MTLYLLYGVNCPEIIHETLTIGLQHRTMKHYADQLTTRRRFEFGPEAGQHDIVRMQLAVYRLLHSAEEDPASGKRSDTLG